LPLVQNLVTGTASILSSAFVIGGGLGLLDEETTITRMIGVVMARVRLTTVEAEATIAVGCAVVRAEALVAGVAALPSPESDPDFEWLYYGVFPMVTGMTAGAEESSTIILPFDVRSQRIVRSGSTVVWLAESEGQNASAGVGGRYLVKLT